MDAPSTLAKPLFSVRLRWQYALPPSQDFLRVRPSHGAAQSATRLITAHSSCSRDDAIGEGILAAQTRTYIQAETGLKSICHWARSIVIRVISVDLGMSASRLVRRHSRKCRLSGFGERRAGGAIRGLNSKAGSSLRPTARTKFHHHLGRSSAPTEAGVETKRG